VFIVNFTLESHYATPAQAQALDVSLYPRTYQASLVTRVGLGALSTFMVALGALGAFYLPRHENFPNASSLTTLVALSTIFALLALYLAAEIFTVRLTLRSDAIELRSLTQNRTLSRGEIAGLRIRPTQYFSVYELVPRTRGAKKLKLTMLFERDAAFHAWFATLLDLDAVERQQSVARITKDLEFGATAEDRVARLAQAKLIARALTAVAIAVALWGLFYPSPYRAAVGALALLPLVPLLLMATNNGLYQIEGRKQDARPDLSMAFMLPGFILALRAFQDLQLLSWPIVVKLTLSLTLLLVLIIAASDPQLRARRWPLLIFLFLTPLYTMGAVIEANALLDHGGAQLLRPHVLAKHASHGRSTTYYLRLEPWGPRTEVNDVTVSGSLYRRVAVGESVCVLLRPGALQTPWFIVSRCN
jgi:hypothetical protein